MLAESRRHQRTQQLCARGGLSQYARLHESASAEVKVDKSLVRVTGMVAWIEKQPSRTGRWNSGTTSGCCLELLRQNSPRKLPATTR